MNLKELLGDAYKENMTIDEVNEALANITAPKTVSKEQWDKTASELASSKKLVRELQEKLRELEESSMTAEEKLKAETERAQELQKALSQKLSALKAKEIFVSAGLTEADYSSILDVVVSEDEETTKTRAKSMVDLISAQKAAVEKAVKAELLKGTPKPPAGEGSNTGGDFEKEIEAARANGDMATVAALIRQKAMSEKK
jgi:cysteinyl-tRNA synthetase